MGRDEDVFERKFTLDTRGRVDEQRIGGESHVRVAVCVTRAGLDYMRPFIERIGRELKVVGWDEQTDWLDTIRNFRDKPIAFELRRRWDGDVEYSSEVETTAFDYRTVETKFTVDPLDDVQYPCTVLRHMGKNQKQSRVQLRQ